MNVKSTSPNFKLKLGEVELKFLTRLDSLLILNYRLLNCYVSLFNPCGFETQIFLP